MSAPEIDYYVHVAAPVAAQEASVGDGELLLAGGTGLAAQRATAILYMVGGALAGVIVPFGLAIILSLFMFSGLDGGDIAFVVAIGILIGGGGISIGVASYRLWRRRPALTVGDSTLRLRYPGFATPFVVARDSVRVVAIDDTSAQLFRQNRRFRVTGSVPPDSFADALDLPERLPFGPRTGPAPFPLPPSPQVPGDAYLFGPDGSSLPFLRVNPEDVPNVAVIFHEPLPTPRRPVALGIAGCSVVYPGGRAIRGMLLRLSDARALAAAIRDWGVVRDVTAADVVEEGLFVPKPLVGIRRIAWTVLTVLPLVLKLLLFRHHRL